MTPQLYEKLVIGGVKLLSEMADVTGDPVLLSYEVDYSALYLQICVGFKLYALFGIEAVYCRHKSYNALVYDILRRGIF